MTFWCDVTGLEIDAGDVVKATVIVNIFQGHKAFKSSFTQQIQ